MLTVSGMPDFRLFTLEDEWRDNRQSVSCIPPGRYQCVPHGWAPNTKLKFKRVWQLQNVPGRSAILIHAGNTIEDTSGCILVGNGMVFGESSVRLTESQAGLDRLRRLTGNAGFQLTVEQR